MTHGTPSITFQFHVDDSVLRFEWRQPSMLNLCAPRRAHPLHCAALPIAAPIILLPVGLAPTHASGRTVPARFTA